MKQFFKDFYDDLFEDEPLYFDALENIAGVFKKELDWKEVFGLRNIVGMEGSHKLTPWWEKIWIFILTLFCYLVGLAGLIGIIMFFVCTFVYEFFAFWRDRVKDKRRKKAVQKIMKKRKQAIGA